jgi:hypothetical protein
VETTQVGPTIPIGAAEALGSGDTAADGLETPVLAQAETAIIARATRLTVRREIHIDDGS